MRLRKLWTSTCLWALPLLIALLPLRPALAAVHDPEEPEKILQGQIDERLSNNRDHAKEELLDNIVPEYPTCFSPPEQASSEGHLLVGNVYDVQDGDRFGGVEFLFLALENLLEYSGEIPLTALMYTAVRGEDGAEQVKEEWCRHFTVRTSQVVEPGSIFFNTPLYPAVWTKFAIPEEVQIRHEASLLFVGYRIPKWAIEGHLLAPSGAVVSSALESSVYAEDGSRAIPGLELEWFEELMVPEPPCDEENPCPPIPEAGVDTPPIYIMIHAKATPPP